MSDSLIVASNSQNAFVSYVCSNCNVPLTAPLSISISSITNANIGFTTRSRQESLDNAYYLTNGALSAIIAHFSKDGIPASVLCNPHSTYEMDECGFRLVFYSDCCPLCGHIEPWMNDENAYYSLRKNNRPLIHRTLSDSTIWAKQVLEKNIESVTIRRNVPELLEEAQNKVNNAISIIIGLQKEKSAIAGNADVDLERKLSELKEYKKTLKMFDVRNKRIVNDEIRKIQINLDIFNSKKIEQIKNIDKQIQDEKEIIKENQAVAYGYYPNIFIKKSKYVQCFYLKHKDLPKEIIELLKINPDTNSIV